jgi:pyrroline-5-carboxylate reductase
MKGRMIVKIGFIGCGNMAQAMIGGMVESGNISAEDIRVANPIAEQLDLVHQKYGVDITDDNKEVATWADVLILAVKPDRIDLILDEIKDHLPLERGITVSIAAGITLDHLEGKINLPGAKVIRTMPNTPALVGAGMTAIAGNSNVTDDEIALVQRLFGSFGKTLVLDEKFFHIVTAASGSSPALVYMLIEAMADAAVKGGIKRDDAYVLTAQSVFGAAKMVLETKQHPGVLKDQVCSPGGTTIEMVETLERNQFRGAVMEALEAAAEKSQQLSRNEKIVKQNLDRI